MLQDVEVCHTHNLQARTPNVNIASPSHYSPKRQPVENHFLQSCPRLKLQFKTRPPGCRFSIYKDAPALTSPSSIATHSGLEILHRLLQDLIIERARLEPDAPDTELLRLLEYLDRDLGRRDDAHGCLGGVWQRREVRQGGVFLDLESWEGWEGFDAGRTGVDGRYGESVVGVPGEDCMYC